MNINFRFAWIDDTPERAKRWDGGLDGNLVNDAVHVDLQVIQVTENSLVDLNQQVDEWMKSPPNLIMLDHDMSKVKKRLFSLHGSAFAHLLRIQLPNIPIVCVSGQKLESDEFSAEDISEYTYLIDVNKLNSEENLEILFAIAKDFPSLNFPTKQPVRSAIVDLLNPPEIDRQALLSILPEEFEGTFVHSTSPHRVARWILNVFMKHPGFLCDTLETATLFGLTEYAFLIKAAHHFASARYQGPFKTETRPLWWSSALTDVLYALLPEHSLLSPQDVGRKLNGIEEGDFSRCGMTNETSPAPDVVAFTDETKSERKAVRQSFTTALSENASSVLGFSAYLKIRNPRREE